MASIHSRARASALAQATHASRTVVQHINQPTKMRKILTFVFTLLIFVSCSEKRNDLKENNLKGKVWKIQETAFNAIDKFGSYQTEDKKYSGHSFLIFNELGNIIEYRSLNERGKTNWTNKHSYNKDNIRTEVTTIEDGKVDRKQISIIENDKIKGIEFYDKDGIKTETYEYELSGKNILGGKVKNKHNKLTASFENELSNGFLDKQTVRDSLGNLDYQVFYKRNKQNDVIEYKYVNKKDSVNDTYKFQYEYDEQNNWIKRIDFDKENKLDQIVIRNIIYFSDKEKKKKQKTTSSECGLF
jgi:hypothetical protein